MPIAYWNTAQTLFWIIVREWPTDTLLDRDDELALAASLLASGKMTTAQFLPRSEIFGLTEIPLSFDAVKTPSARAIADATCELSAALRTKDVICSDAHNISDVHSSIDGFFIKVPGGKKFRLSFPVGMVQKKWPPNKLSGEKRGRKPRYDADGFFAEAMALLKKKRGISSRFPEATFKAQMPGVDVGQVARRTKTNVGEGTFGLSPPGI